MPKKIARASIGPGLPLPHPSGIVIGANALVSPDVPARSLVKVPPQSPAAPP